MIILRLNVVHVSFFKNIILVVDKSRYLVTISYKYQMVYNYVFNKS